MDPQRPDPDEPQGVVVPHDSLEADTLRRLIEEFVTREGTEYGRNDVALDDKVRQVGAQLQRGDAAIVFDPETGTAGIVPARSLPSGKGRQDADPE